MGWAPLQNGRKRRLGSRLVRVTDSFQEDINRLFNERSGHAGYVATRKSAQAIGKTLWIRSQRGDLGFAVLLDSNQIGQWGLNNPKCLTTVLHELFHVLQDEHHIQRLGEEEFTAEADSRERWLNNWATMLLDEFDVDRQVDNLVCELATKDDGQPWCLRELGEDQGVDWVQGLLDGFHQIPSSIEEKVWQFQIGQMEIDDLAIAVTSQIKDILRLLSHTASRYMGTEAWPNIVEQIKDTEAAQRFFKEHLDTILGQLDDTKSPFKESAQIVAKAVEEIFYNCGLSFKTVPEGVYISVNAPSR